MSVHREIECLAKLNDEIYCFSEISDFLLAEKIIEPMKYSELKNTIRRELPYALHAIFTHAIRQDVLQLVDYHWELLPKEKICITIVSTMAKRDFCWNC
jgi:hypothetical protein